MSVDHAEKKLVTRMDIKRLIEASANDRLSELSCDCQVYEKHKKDECKEAYLFEMNLSDEKTSQSK